MSVRHFELPARPSLEYYRKQAKRLQHAYEAGDAEAVARVADVLGTRATERFLLSDAQFVLAQEHGFRTWAEFRTRIESPITTEGRPVSHILGLGESTYESLARTLFAELRRNDPGALQRLRTYVPRHADAVDGSTAERRDARLIIARELGFPTWRELLSYSAKFKRERDERKQRWRQLEPGTEALLAGDTGRLAGLTAEQADDLLYLFAMREQIPGIQLGRELGAPRPAVDVLVGKATSLGIPLVEAARWNRVEYIGLLLDAGADLGARHEGHTPLENAIYSEHTEVVDLFADRGIVPPALWTYAACGRLDLVRGCFDPDGRLLPGSAASRPEPPVPLPGLQPVRSEESEESIVGEAFVMACAHGRTDVVRWFLDQGVQPNNAYYYRRTGLHWAIQSSHVEVIRLLLERGADPSIRDGLMNVDADGLVHLLLLSHGHDPTAEQIHHLIQSYQAKRP